MTCALGTNGTMPLRPGGRGLSVSCRAGTMVVTQEGDPLDHVLRAGEAFRAAPRRLVVVWALSDGAVAVGVPGEGE
ncbi:MAG TPA: DUF2917 domain-containing protein [Anaeromyxobacteraceae bacterium]|nr:DUF2917 domain-containing protein [Anaeromyxobacteraceae bacterium]